MQAQVVVSKRYDALEFYAVAADSHEYWDTFWAQSQVKGQWDRAITGHLPHQLRWAVERWLPAGGRVLEAGCGLGCFTLAMAARGFQAEGVDFASGVVARLSQEFPYAKFHVGDVRSLDRPAGSFDAIFSPGVAEHFQDGPQPILAEAHRLLSADGVLLLSMPVYDRLRKWLAHRDRFTTRPQDDAEFYQYAFSPSAVEEFLTAAGFELLAFRAYGVSKLLTDHAGLPAIGSRFGSRVVGRVLDAALGPLGVGHTGLWVARRAG